MSEVRDFCRMVSDPENQPHQWVGDVDGAMDCLGRAIKEATPAVVTPKGLAAAELAVQREVVRKLMGEAEPSEDYSARLAAAVLEAAGIQVVDEVVEVGENELGELLHGDPEDSNPVSTLLNPGDKLYIQRGDTPAVADKED